jgi:PAS domain S-box-containing protein
MDTDPEKVGDRSEIESPQMKIESLMGRLEGSKGIPPDLEEVLAELRIVISDLGNQLAFADDVRPAYQAAQEWELTFDSVPDMIAILDEQHHIKRINASMARRLGSDPERLIGMTCFTCLHGTDHSISGCPHSLTLRDGKEHFAELHEDHINADLLVSTTPIVDERGKIVGSVHVARDITERKRSEVALKAANEELLRFNQAMVGRELRMIELKKEVNDLCQLCGLPARYNLDFDEEVI